MRNKFQLQPLQDDGPDLVWPTHTCSAFVDASLVSFHINVAIQFTMSPHRRVSTLVSRDTSIARIEVQQWKVVVMFARWAAFWPAKYNNQTSGQKQVRGYCSCTRGEDKRQTLTVLRHITVFEPLILHACMHNHKSKYVSLMSVGGHIVFAKGTRMWFHAQKQETGTWHCFHGWNVSASQDDPEILQESEKWVYHPHRALHSCDESRSPKAFLTTSQNVGSPTSGTSCNCPTLRLINSRTPDPKCSPFGIWQNLLWSCLSWCFKASIWYQGWK